MVTEEECKNLNKSVELITQNPFDLAPIWLFATEGDKDMWLAALDHWNETEVVKNETKKLKALETVWRDFYTGQRLENSD